MKLEAELVSCYAALIQTYAISNVRAALDQPGIWVMFQATPNPQAIYVGDVSKRYQICMSPRNAPERRRLTFSAQ
jgi:hypothetical protein